MFMHILEWNLPPNVETIVFTALLFMYIAPERLIIHVE